jgi:hypothetical protein
VVGRGCGKERNRFLRRRRRRRRLDCRYRPNRS